MTQIRFFPNKLQKAYSKKQTVVASVRDFCSDQGLELQKYFVYFKISNRRAGEKDPMKAGEMF